MWAEILDLFSNQGDRRKLKCKSWWISIRIARQYPLPEIVNGQTKNELDKGNFSLAGETGSMLRNKGGSR